jgi:hypothetical protein
MVGGYLFNQTTTKTLTKEEYLFGYEDTRLQLAFNNTADYFDGMEVDMPAYFTPTIVDKSPLSLEQKTGIYTGSVSLDKVARVRFLNEKNYLNRQMPIFDGAERTMMPVTTGGIERFTKATNGMQFAPGVVQNDDKLTLFDDQLLALTDYKSNGDIDSDFGKSGSGIQVKRYDADAAVLPGSLLTGQMVDQSVTNAYIKLQPETGLMLERGQKVDNALTIPGASSKDANS